MFSWLKLNNCERGMTEWHGKHGGREEQGKLKKGTPFWLEPLPGRFLYPPM